VSADAEPSPYPILTTERLILREIVAADADDVFQFRGDPEVQRYNLAPMHHRSEALGLIRTMRTWYASHFAIQWGITVRGEGRVLGICGLHDWNGRQRRAAIGYDLVRERWGQGIASEAIRAVIAYGFEAWQLRRIEAVTIAENDRSVRMLERLGFRLDGERRDSTLEDDIRFRGSAAHGMPRQTYILDADEAADRERRTS